MLGVAGPGVVAVTVVGAAAASLGDAGSASASGAEEGRLRQLKPLRDSCCGSEVADQWLNGMYVGTHPIDCLGTSTTLQAALLVVLWPAQTGNISVLMQA